MQCVTGTYWKDGKDEECWGAVRMKADPRAPYCGDRYKLIKLCHCPCGNNLFAVTMVPVFTMLESDVSLMFSDKNI